MVLPPDERLAKPGIQRTRALAISPSGSHIVYATDDELYLRAMDRTETAPVVGTEALQPARPFFSADGEWIGFYSGRDRELKKIAIAGGVAISIARADPIMGATWGADDMILFGQGPGGIMQVPGSGGVPEIIVPVNGAEGEQARMPQLLPGKRAVLFTLATGGGGPPWLNAQIVVHKLDSGTRRVLVEPGTDARYLSTGHLVYEREQGLVAAPFDVGRLDITGELLVPLVERVNSPNFAVGDDGSLVFLRASVVRHERRLIWVYRDGREEFLPAEARFYDSVRISPDGSRVALVVKDQEQRLSGEIYILDLVRDALIRLTIDPSADLIPTRAPDGERLAFGSLRDGSFDVYVKAADGTGAAEQLTDSPNDSPPWDFTSDGEWLVFGDYHPESGLDLHLMALEGSHESDVLLATEFDEWKAMVSPDDHWLVYQSNASGQVEIYLRPFPDVQDGRWQLSSGGGAHPRWAPNGREIFYRSPDGELMLVPIQTEPSVVYGRPSKLFDGLLVNYDAAGDDYTYDIAPDGQRFLVIGKRPSPQTLSRGSTNSTSSSTGSRSSTVSFPQTTRRGEREVQNPPRSTILGTSEIGQCPRTPTSLRERVLESRPMKLYVGNLPYNASEASLRQLFSRHGPVQDVWIGNTRVGSPHGYGFVHMADGSKAEKAISMLDGVQFEGKEITVHQARD